MNMNNNATTIPLPQRTVLAPATNTTPIMAEGLTGHNMMHTTTTTTTTTGPVVQGHQHAPSIPAAAMVDHKVAGLHPSTQIAGGVHPSIGSVPVAQQFLVQNHPDTNPKLGMGRIEVASLDPMAPANMNNDPTAKTLTNVAAVPTHVPAAPAVGGVHPTGSATHTTHETTTTAHHPTVGEKIKGLFTHHKTNSTDKTAHTTTTTAHASPVEHAKEKVKAMMGVTNVVAETPSATHLGGNPAITTNANVLTPATHADIKNPHLHTEHTAAGAVASHGLKKHADIADEINTNPVSTAHPHANVPRGDLHTNQLAHAPHGIAHIHEPGTTMGPGHARMGHHEVIAPINNKHAVNTDTTHIKEHNMAL